MTAEQNTVIDALATEHGSVRVLRLELSDAVIVCGCDPDDHSCRLSPWVYVRSNGTVDQPYRGEIADALEFADRVAGSQVRLGAAC